MRHWSSVSGLILGISLAGSLAISQDKTPGAIPKVGEEVLVKREAARLIDPAKYRAHLYLEPYLTVVVAAPFDGVVKQVASKANAQVKAQAEVVRLENVAQKLALQKAQADFKAASIEQKEADKKSETQAALASARSESAKAALDLAQYYFDQTAVRAPISGEVLRIFVVEGQYVRAGDPLLQVGDNSRMKVEIPAERSQLEKDKSFPIKVEAAEVQGKVEAVLPLLAKFDPLRDLFESVASATIVLDNPDGKFKPGQTVYVPLIPRNAVVEVPSGAVGNTTDGGRKVQVLRQSMVRDLPITLMAQVGTSRLFVSGPFADGDEVIYESSHQLPDGYQLLPAGTAAKSTATQTGAGSGSGTIGVTRPGGGGF